MKNAPPGWEPHRIVTRIDGWCVTDPEHEHRAPAGVAALIARALPQPTDIEIIRARMINAPADDGAPPWQ
jgi:hypothetical protein